MIRRSFLALSGLLLAGPVAAQQPPLKVALIYSKTGPLEAYARQTEAGFMLGLEYATKGTMEVDGRKIQVILKDDQFKPDLAKAALEQAYGDDKVDIAVGTTGSAGALAMLPVAEEYKKLLIVEPAVADQITGEKWNRYIFRTGRNSTQDALASAATLKDENISIATLAQDYAFGKDGVAAVKAALAAVGSKAKVVHEEYAPQATTDFTASAQRIFDALKDKPGRKVVVVVWAGAHPLPKLMDLKPERFGIEMAPGGNLLPVMAGWKQFPGLEGAIYYYWGFPKNPVNDWLVTEYKKKNNGVPPDFFVAGGMSAAIALVEGVKKAKSTDSEKPGKKDGVSTPPIVSVLAFSGFRLALPLVTVLARADGGRTLAGTLDAVLPVVERQSYPNIEILGVGGPADAGWTDSRDPVRRQALPIRSIVVEPETEPATRPAHSTRPCGPPPSGGRPSYAPTYPRTARCHRRPATTCRRRSSPSAATPPPRSSSPRWHHHHRRRHHHCVSRDTAGGVRSYGRGPPGASPGSAGSCRRNTTSAYGTTPRGRIRRAPASPMRRRGHRTTRHARHRTRPTGSRRPRGTTTSSATSSSTSLLVLCVARDGGRVSNADKRQRQRRGAEGDVLVRCRAMA